MHDQNSETSPESYEEVFCEHEIYIEPNPDHYRGGFAWSVCKDDCEIDCGLANSMDEALADAHLLIKKIA